MNIKNLLSIFYKNTFNNYIPDFVMQKIFSTLVFLAGLSIAGQAQNGYKPAYPFEVGVQLGTAMFLGDLGGQSGIGRPFLRDSDFKAIRPNFGIYGRWNPSPYFSARLDLGFLMLKGDDNLASDGTRGGFSGTDPNTGGGDDAWFRYYRQLNFRSRVFEGSISAEIIPYNFELGGGYQSYSVLSPYGFIGIGIFNFRPQGNTPDGAWVDLKPLKTEGQGFVPGRLDYKLTQLNIPLGLGLKWSYNDQWAMCVEVNHRLTFTDYIDDLSTDYIDPKLFIDNMPVDQARLAIAMSRRSIEIDPGSTVTYNGVTFNTGGVNARVSNPSEQRGDPKDNDSYYTITLRFSYFIDPSSLGGGRRYGCPVW
jgi:hypothetical protein